MRRLSPPIRGCGNVTPYIDTPGDLAPPEAVRNYRTHDTSKDRPRGGQRAGLVDAFSYRLPSSPVQAIRSVGVASQITGLNVLEGTCVSITTGESRVGTSIAGHAFLLDAQLGVDRWLNNSANSGAVQAPTVAWHPDGTKCAYVTNYTDGVGVADVIMVDASDGSVLWRTTISDAPVGGGPASESIAANTIEIGTDWVFVTAGEYIYVLAVSDGTYTQRHDMNGWANEVVEARLRPDGKLIACFDGSGSNAHLPGYGGAPVAPDGSHDGKLPNGTLVTAGASHFRAGVMMFTVNAAPLDVGEEPLEWVRFGSVIASDSDFYEADHGYFRVSEWSNAAPRGCKMEGLAVLPDNSVVVARRNSGWGPNGSYLPDGTGGYITLFCLDSTGLLLWETDTDSIRQEYEIAWLASSVYNDLTNTGNADGGDADSIHPSIQAVETTPDGFIVAGGRYAPNAQANLFLLAPTGELLVKTRTGPTSGDEALVWPDGIGVDPTDGTLLVCTRRNNDWPDASSAYATMFRVNPVTLAFERTFEFLNDTQSVLTAAVSVDGTVLIGSEYVS